MPWFSLIADGSRSGDRLPALSGEWTKPSSRASPSFRAWPTPRKGRSNPNQDCKRTSELELMSSNDDYKNKARRPTKNREF